MTVQELNTVLGKNIRLYRGVKNITQAELSKEIGVTAQILSLWESGKRMVRTSNLTLLASVLGVQVWELFYTGKTVLMGDEKLLGRDNWKQGG